MSQKRIVLKEGTFPNQCSGCKLCELICSFTHYKIFNPSLSRIRVIINEQELINFPVVCQQCKNPACHSVCPTQAISRNHLGVNQIDEQLCMGCSECATTCPFGAIYMVEQTDKTLIPISCDLCGGDPRCVQYCPSRVLIYKVDNEGTEEEISTSIPG